MRACILVLVACGGSQPKPHDLPPLPPEGSAAAPIPSNGPACMPAGGYVATWDTSAVEITGHGEMQGDEAWCKEMAKIIPEQQMRRAAIDFDGGTLHVAWPTPMTVTANGDCGFEINGVVQIKVAFENAKGTGTAEFSVGATNNPQEGSCTARGVKVSLERE